MPLTHTIRPAKEADADAIAEAHVDSIRTLGPGAYDAAIIEVWGAPRSGARYVSAMRQGETFFVAVPVPENDDVLGFSSHRVENGCHRTAIYVRGTATRQGIGSELIRRSIDAARSLGAKDVHVDASLIAVPFYLRNGFVEIGAGSHTLQGGLEMPCVYMKKPLVRYTVRSATNADRPFVEGIYFQTQRYIIEALFGWRGDETEQEKFAECYDVSNTTIIAKQRKDIGWMTVARRPDHIELEHLYLDERSQGQGIGSELLHDLIKESAATGVPLRLSTAKMNRARRLYERFGFAEVHADEFKVYLERRMQ